MLPLAICGADSGRSMIEDSETILRVAQEEALAREWELVLLAQGLSPHLHRTPDGMVLTVPRVEFDRAVAGLAAYEHDNSSKARQPDLRTTSFDLRAGSVAALLLMGCYLASIAWSSVPWLERGSADAARIFDGELWRTVTALTLHGDAAHAVGNAFAIAVFFGAASGQLGTGVAAALVLLAGAAGNLVNAYLRGSPHVAIGASTAVFAAVGMLGSLAVMRRRATGDKRRAWIGVAAALALLGMLGSGGARVDFSAHFLGFLSGAALGILAALICARPRGALVQWSCGAATIALIGYCWIRAMSS
jgi:membrane associated rhomboid family serine protease